MPRFKILFSVRENAMSYVSRKFLKVKESEVYIQHTTTSYSNILPLEFTLMIERNATWKYEIQL